MRLKSTKYKRFYESIYKYPTTYYRGVELTAGHIRAKQAVESKHGIKLPDETKVSKKAGQWVFSVPLSFFNK